jgi:hypothetical protein
VTRLVKDGQFGTKPLKAAQFVLANKMKARLARANAAFQGPEHDRPKRFTAAGGRANRGTRPAGPPALRRRV